jgi:Flp pilus assembly protein TadD
MIRAIFILLLIFIYSSCAVKNGTVNEYFSQGIQDYNSKKYASSVAKLTKAISLDGENEEAYIIRGHAYAELGKFDMATFDYKKAIKTVAKQS